MSKYEIEVKEDKMIPNFWLIMLCAIIAIGAGALAAIFNGKKKK